MELFLVRGGCYKMGNVFASGSKDERPVHEVCVDDFYIGKYPVTQGQWKAVMGDNPSDFKLGDDYPVENISWSDAQEFTNKLNRMTGRKYRLPTEAEWEYAARSGGKDERWAGTSELSELDKFAYYEDNSGHTTHPVGKKKPNGLGLHDMSGNVWEWVADWYGERYYDESPRNNPAGEGWGEQKVLRGGSWDLDCWALRTSYRCRAAPSCRSHYYGVRLAFSPA